MKINGQDFKIKNKYELVELSTIDISGKEYMVTRIEGMNTYITDIQDRDFTKDRILKEDEDWVLTGEPVTNTDGTVREKYKKYIS